MAIWVVWGSADPWSLDTPNLPTEIIPTKIA